MQEYTFNMHGITAKLKSDDPSVAKDIKEEIREFETSKAGKPEICVQFISETESVKYRQVIAKSERITDTVYSFTDLEKLCGTVTAAKEYSRDEAVLVTLSLIGCLLRFRLAVLKDVTAMHSASFALGDKGILFAGYSGAGKTTISCSFIENKFNYLSDEETLIEKKNGKLYLLALPRNLRLGENFANSVEGRRILKSYRLKNHKAFYEKGWILNPRDMRKDCIANKKKLSICIILKNSDNLRKLSIKPLKDISALYRLISLSEMLSSEKEGKDIYQQLQINNRKAFEIANFLFDTVPLYEIKYNLKRHFRELPVKIKGLLETRDEKGNIRKNSGTAG